MREPNGVDNGWESDYVMSVYSPPPHAVHPPDQITLVIEESEGTLRRLQIHSDNIVSLLHGIGQSYPVAKSLQTKYRHLQLFLSDWLVVKTGEARGQTPTCHLDYV